MAQLTLRLLSELFAVSRMKIDDALPKWAVDAPWFSITKTDDELSIVSHEAAVPEHIKSEKGWRMFKVLGPLDFSMVGVLARLSNTMKKSGISIFVVSTYDTDYLMVKETEVMKAKNAFEGNGLVIV